MAKDCSEYVLYSDFDRTFKMPDSDAGVEININAVKKFIEMGGSFAFATGRGSDYFVSLAPYYKEISNAPMIHYNGGYIYDIKRDTVINNEYTDSTEFRVLGKKIKSVFGDAKLIVHLASKGLISNAGSLDDIDEMDWMKLAIAYDPEFIPEITRIAKEELGDNYNFVRSSPGCIEVMPRTVSKGRALERIRQYYSDVLHTPKKVCAIGDFENDTDMIEHADISAAPSNALEDIKKIATYTVCDCSKGAIADFIDIIINLNHTK